MDDEKKDFKIRLVLLIAIGFFIGVVLKTEASERFVVGHDDPNVKSYKQGYDFNEIRENNIKNSQINEMNIEDEE